MVKNNYAGVTVSVALLGALISSLFSDCPAIAGTSVKKSNSSSPASKKVVPPDYYPLADTYWWKFKGNSGGNLCLWVISGHGRVRA